MGAPHTVMFLAPRRDTGAVVVRFLAGIPGVAPDGRDTGKTVPPTPNNHGTLQIVSVLFILLIFIFISCCLL